MTEANQMQLCDLLEWRSWNGPSGQVDHKLPPALQGLVNPSTLMMRDNQCTHIWSVSPHVNKHLIKFPIALDYTTLRGSREEWNNMENSTKSTTHSTQSVLLKADTGANVNLMNRKTFDQLFGQAKGVLQLTPIRMENYGNTAVKVLRMFHAFLRWKDKVYKQLFYVTDCERSPNLLSRDACYTLGVLKPCYIVENSTDSTDSTHASNKSDLVAKSFLHKKMKESERKLSNCSNKWSISKSQHQGSPLTSRTSLTSTLMFSQE